MPRPRRSRLVAFLAAVLLTSCLPTPAAPESPARTPQGQAEATPYPTSPAGPLPEVAFSSLVVLPGVVEGEWRVLGLATNDSSSPLEAVRLRVQILGEEGEPENETTVALPLSVLPPKASSPFVAEVRQTAAPSRARASLESFLFSSAEAVSLRVGAVDTTKVPDGVFVRGTVQAGDPFSIRANDVVVAWRAADRSLAGLAVASVAEGSSTEGRSLPWIAFAPGAGSESRFEVFTAAVVPESGGTPSIVFAEGPRWRVTSQGEGFATGAVRNDGTVAVYPVVTIAAYASGRPVGLQTQESRVPLQPGEALAFVADRFVGLEAVLAAEGLRADSLSLEAYLDERPASADTNAPIPLPLSIQQFEAIGSGVFLRGSISGPAPTALYRAMVFVSVRSTEGELVSARWQELIPPPGQTGAEFSADLPLPSGVDAAMCEYDVRAIGLPLSDSAW